MAYEERDFSATMFKNDRKEKPSHPDYRGSAMVNGEKYWVSGWIKTAGSSAKNPGSKFFSIAFTPMDDNGFNRPDPKPRQNQRDQHQQNNNRTFDEYDDDIPF